MLAETTIIALGSFLVNALNSLKKKDVETAKRLEEKIDFKQVAISYGEHLVSRYGKIKILNMEKPIELGKHYTRVNILHKITARTKNKVELLEQQLKDDGHFGKVKKTRPAIELITELDPKNNNYNNIVVLGKPGAGKTTFLRYMALQALEGTKGQIKRDVLPILVELRYLSQSNKSLTEFIEEEFKVCGIDMPETKILIEHLLNEGKCLVLLDGLDEVSKGKTDEVVKAVRDLVDKYKKNQFVLSCRIAAYNHVFEQFIDVEIADFNEGQVTDFVFAWFGSDETKSKTFLEQFRQNKSIKELASTPLLLALMCIDYDNRMEFPSNRAELYEQCIDTLLETWDGKRSIKRDELYKNLTKKNKRLMFASLANKMFDKGVNFLPEKVLSEWIGEFIRNLPNIKPEEIELDSKQIIKSIEAQHGIFVERAETIYSFSHLTVQEYFTAKYIVDNTKRFQEVIEANLLNFRWREIILLSIGVVGEADEFLLTIKRKVDSLVDAELGYLLGQIFESNKLTEFIAEPDKVSYTLRTFPLGIRSIRLFIFCVNANHLVNAIDYDIDLAFEPRFDLAFANARDLAYVFASDFDVVSELDLSVEHRLDDDMIIGFTRNFALEINWFEKLLEAHDKIQADTNTMPDIGVFNKAIEKAIPEINKLNDYLYATNLLVECLNSDCYISKETREKIMSELLTVPEGV